jgi:predicted secreted protein
MALLGAAMITFLAKSGCSSSIAPKSVELVVNSQTSDSLSLKRAADLTLKLPARVAGGFIWTLEKAPDACAVSESNFEEHSAELAYQVFHIRCEHTGAVSLSFWYGRETSEPAVKTFTLRMNVTD